MNRREMFGLAAGAALAHAMRGASAKESRKTRAIVFDAFPIFDPRPVGALAESLLPGKGAALMNAWRSRQFEYQWLHALADQYVDFEQCTERSLVFAARQLQTAMSDSIRPSLVRAYSELPVWPDVVEVLPALKKAGLRLALLSNMTARMLQANAKRSGIEGLFDQVISSDELGSYKPSPKAYRLALDRLQLPREEILFAPFAGWDAAGGKWFGFPTFWVNRLDSTAEELGTAPDAVGRDLHALAVHVGVS
jgi:2-haloacid dehalogenase